ncbi:MAG TPA: MopE-related protein [Polyangium sp.]|nr:MopE-related protein [Polyangium sp.]
MRSTIPATLLALGCCLVFSFQAAGCATDNTPDGFSGGNGNATGGAAGSGGAPMCVPVDELCDGRDNDCDDEVDEGCPCTEGQTQACYSGPEGTLGVGACTTGQQTCDATGTWGVCRGEVKPRSNELCNFQDDDCNGLPDDMGMTTCGEGACQVTVQTCENGVLNMCVAKPPGLELCDGIDNNCNKQIDETFPNQGRACIVPDKEGPCKNGKKACVAGAETCVPNVMPALVEACNDIDDDCDGLVDNNVPGTGFACATGYAGVCAAGQQQCKGGAVGCFPLVAASPETCNGLDDDCDGVVDDNNPGGNMVCDTGQPDLCAIGLTQCANGMLKCVANSSAQVEVCNGVDDDCDGQVDENNPGGNVACGCGGMRACVAGKLVCQGGPTVFLEENFADPIGWSTDPEWEIRATPGSGTCGDPTSDSSPTTDNFLAGVRVGGCNLAQPHGYYYLTSPTFDTANASMVILTFQRWLRSDYAPYMNNVVQVYNGAAWYTVWQTGAQVITDTTWTKMTFDLTTYRNANMQIRFGFNVGAPGSMAVGSWNVDDVLVMADTCP